MSTPNSRGNSTLELLFFLPLALLALSAALDSGLNSIDAAQIDDILRYLPQNSTSTTSVTPIVDLSNLRAPSAPAIDAVTNQIAQSLSGELIPYLSDLSVEVVGAVMQVDSQTGELSAEPIVAADSIIGISHPTRASVALRRTLKERTSANPSAYAIQLTTVERTRFLPWTIAIAVSVSGKTRSLYPTLVQAQLGSRYSITRETVFPLRRLSH